MKIKYFQLLLLVLIQSCKPQNNVDAETIKTAFLEEQTTEFGASINNYLNTNYYEINALNQSDFTTKIDSLKNIYITHLNTYEGKLDKSDFNNEVLVINSYLDKYILEYPREHKKFTGEKIVLSKNNQSKLDALGVYFNDVDKLSNKEYKTFVNSFISIASNKKLKSKIYDKLDNQQLTADWNTIESTFTNQDVNDFWKQDYLYEHIDNLGIKNIDKFYTSFISSCQTSEYKTKIQDFYTSHKKGRESHSIEPYKSVDDFELEMHIFLPDTLIFKGNRPTIVYFHGGSWSEGKPDWFFKTGKAYAKKGWVATAVEYRIKGRQGTYPFEAVKDAKSAIRWLRENSEKYKIDTNKIVATGNSAGGHLCIAATLVDNWNEKSDNLKISAVPNTVIVNSAVYDLTVNNTRWITAYDENKDLVKEISPNSITKKTATKFLLIHGENDRNCLYSTADYFYEKMKSLGNTIELHQINNAEHFIWFGNYPEVAKITRDYIQTLNLE